MGEIDNDETSTLIEGSDDGSGETFDASVLGGSSEDGNGSENDNNGGIIGSAPDEGRKRDLYHCRSGVCGRTVVTHPMISYKNTTPPRPCPFPLGG